MMVYRDLQSRLIGFREVVLFYWKYNIYFFFYKDLNFYVYITDNSNFKSMIIVS